MNVKTVEEVALCGGERRRSKSVMGSEGFLQRNKIKSTWNKGDLFLSPVRQEGSPKKIFSRKFSSISDRLTRS
jgi:hypothetical protein